MFNNSGVLAVILSLELLMMVTQTEAWYLGVGRLPSCAYNCLNRVISEQYTCQDLKCFCQTPSLIKSSEICFRKDCDFNSLSRAFKLIATCQESYGSTPSPPSPSPSPSPSPVAAPTTPAVIYPNPYLPPGSAPIIVSPYNPQFNGASPYFLPQPQAPTTARSPSSPINQAPAAQPQASWTGSPYASQLQALTTGSLPALQDSAPTGGQTSGAGEQTPGSGGKTSGAEAGSQHQIASLKGGLDNSTTSSAPPTKTVTPLFFSSENSSANPSLGPPFNSAAQNLFENRIVYLICCAVVLSFLV